MKYIEYSADFVTGVLSNQSCNIIQLHGFNNNNKKDCLIAKMEQDLINAADTLCLEDHKKKKWFPMSLSFFLLYLLQGFLFCSIQSWLEAKTCGKGRTGI